MWTLLSFPLQLEPKKNMLETLLTDNLEQRREELKKVQLSEREWLYEGEWLCEVEWSISSTLLFPVLCVCVPDAGVHLCG